MVGTAPVAVAMRPRMAWMTSATWMTWARSAPARGGVFAVAVVETVVAGLGVLGVFGVPDCCLVVVRKSDFREDVGMVHCPTNMVAEASMSGRALALGRLGWHAPQ